MAKGRRPKQNPPELIPEDPKTASIIARRHTVPAINTLASIMDTSESEVARVAAARALVDYGHGRAPIQMNLNAGGRVAHIVYSSEAEFRQALLDRGIPARLLPPLLEAGSASAEDDAKE